MPHTLAATPNSYASASPPLPHQTLMLAQLLLPLLPLPLALMLPLLQMPVQQQQPPLPRLRPLPQLLPLPQLPLLPPLHLLDCAGP
jgi:hypothetical protein